MVPAPAAAPASPPAATAPPPAIPPAPPAYAYPPPVAAPPYATAPSTGRIVHHGRFLALPFLGISSIKGENTPSTDPGLRVGVLLGGRVNELVSLNGEIGGDLINEPATAVVSEYIGHLAFSPLLHFSVPGIEFALGPKLGGWGLTGSGSVPGRSISERGHGWLYGINAGFFIPVTDDASLGALFSYAINSSSEICVSATGYAEECVTTGLNDIKVMSLTLALLF